MSKVSERRGNERIAYPVEVSMTSDHNFYVGFTEDISDGGVFIATRTPLPPGTHLEFELGLGKGRVRVEGEVRWIRETDSPGMGIQFVNLHPKIAESINAFLTERREAIFYDD